MQYRIQESKVRIYAKFSVAFFLNSDSCLLNFFYSGYFIQIVRCALRGERMCKKETKATFCPLGGGKYSGRGRGRNLYLSSKENTQPFSSLQVSFFLYQGSNLPQRDENRVPSGRERRGIAQIKIDHLLHPQSGVERGGDHIDPFGGSFPTHNLAAQ